MKDSEVVFIPEFSGQEDRNVKSEEQLHPSGALQVSFVRPLGARAHLSFGDQKSVRAKLILVVKPDF